MRRRAFIAAIGSAAAASPFAAVAQPEHIRRIGILVGSAESDPNIQGWIAEVQNGLAALGWKDGSSIRFERRFGGGDVSRTQHHARELVKLNLDVIVTSSTPAALTLLKETSQPQSYLQIYPTRSEAAWCQILLNPAGTSLASPISSIRLVASGWKS